MHPLTRLPDTSLRRHQDASPQPFRRAPGFPTY